MQPRHWELDTARGLAIIAMVVFHFIFDLAFFTSLPIKLSPLLLSIGVPIGAGIFIVLAGVSLPLKIIRGNITTYKKIAWHCIKRGGIIFGLGMILSLVTWFILPHAFIKFGILHLIGLATIIAIPLVQHPRIAVSIAALLIFTTPFISITTTDNPYLFWLGITTTTFQSIDYYPLIPWLGVFLLGISLSYWLYPQAQRRFTIPPEPMSLEPISWLGRHSLIIYLVHQPILLTLLYVSGLLTI